MIFSPHFNGILSSLKLKRFPKCRKNIINNLASKSGFALMIKIKSTMYHIGTWTYFPSTHFFHEVAFLVI